ncbi:hypothetical protein N9Y42_04760 [Mariniblastus sp.]|nr:hypothetical protein [Mariniblastus sp.]
MNAVNQVAKNLAYTGDIDSALSFLDFCDSERSKRRVKATVFDSLVRRGHLEEAKTMMQSIDPSQAITFESIKFLVRDLVSEGMKTDDPWLIKLRSRSRSFEALVKLGIWIAQADSSNKRAAVDRLEK